MQLFPFRFRRLIPDISYFKIVGLAHSCVHLIKKNGIVADSMLNLLSHIKTFFFLTDSNCFKIKCKKMRPLL